MVRDGPSGFYRKNLGDFSYYTCIFCIWVNSKRPIWQIPDLLKGGNKDCTQKASQCINRSFWEWKVIGLNLISFPGTGQWTALVSCDYVDYCLPVCDYPCNNVESKLKMLAKRKNSVHCHFEYLYYVYLCEKKKGEGEGLSSNAYACQRISPEIMTQCTDKSVQYFYKFLSVCPSVAWLA